MALKNSKNTSQSPSQSAKRANRKKTYKSGPPTSGLTYDLTLSMDEKHHKALETYGPPSILIDENYAIQHISETAGRYLYQPRGPITSDLIKLVRPELQLELRSALFHAFEKSKATFSGPIQVQFNGHPHRVVISVRPQAIAKDEGMVPVKQALVVFLEDEVDRQTEVLVANNTTEINERKGNRNKLVAQLESDALSLREQLQLTVEEYEGSNEELKASNEELQNLWGAMEIPMLFLDRELAIQRHTPSVQLLFNIRLVDHGRSIAHLTHKLLYKEFTNDAEQVLRDLVPVEKEVQAEHGDWYVVRMRPYRTTEARIEGLVITFLDITKLKAAEQAQRELTVKLDERVRGRTRELDDANRRLSQARDLFSRFFHVNPIPTSIARLEDGLFIDVNEAYLNFCGLAREDVINHTSRELKLPLAPEIRPGLVTRVEKEGAIRNLQLDITLPSGEAKTILTSLQHINFGGTEALIVAFNDITERVRDEREVRAAASNMTSAEQAERTRIARILHDDLQQNIFAVKMQLSMLRDSADKNEENSRVDLAQLDEWLADAIATTRQLSVDLSPPILQGEGLAEAVIWLGEQMKDQYHLDVTVEANGIHAVFDEDVRLLVFQTVRELLFNVVKHSETLKATVTFEKMDNEISVTVSDGGKGFETEKVMENWKARHGLLRMRDRLFLLGCNLKIHSVPNDGTRITIEAPVKSF